MFQYLFLLSTMIALTTGDHVIIKEGALFQKVKEVNTITGTWRTAIHIDLDSVTHSLADTVQTLEGLTTFIHSTIFKYTTRYYRKEDAPLSQKLRMLENDIQLILNNTFHVFQTFNSMKTPVGKSKRSILPFFGDALSFLFGTASSTDLSTLQTQIVQLDNKQQRIKHVVEKSISLLNITMGDVQENRQHIITMGDVQENRQHINELKELVAYAIQYTNSSVIQLHREYRKLEEFTSLYTLLLTAVEKSRDILDGIRTVVNKLTLTANFLTLRKLTPSVINPAELHDLFAEISKVLPRHLVLPFELNNKMFEYYDELSCEAVITHKQLLIVVNVPLISRVETLHLYAARSILIPFHTTTTTNLSDRLMARYRLESNALVFNKERTYFSLLDEITFSECQHHDLPFCRIPSPFYPAGLSQLCIVLIFLGRTENINKYCYREVTLKLQEPVVEKLFNNLWTVIAKKPLTMLKFCREHNSETSYTVTTKSPVDVIHLHPACSLTNDLVRIEAQQEFYHTLQLPTWKTDTIPVLNVSDLQVRQPVNENIVSMKSLKIPERLQTIHTMDMNTLIHELHQVQALQTQTSTTTTYTFSIIATIIGLVGVILFIAYRQRFLKKLTTCKRTADDRIDKAKQLCIVHDDTTTSVIGTENIPLVAPENTQSTVNHNISLGSEGKTQQTVTIYPKLPPT